MKYKLEYEASCPGLGKNKGEVEFEAENDAMAEKEIGNVLFHQYSSSQWRNMGATPSNWKPLRLSRIEHLKTFATNVPPNVNYGEFVDKETFLFHVARNDGNDVAQTCERLIDTELGKGNNVDAIKILDRIRQATREIDLAKNKMRTRFAT